MKPTNCREGARAAAARDNFTDAIRLYLAALSEAPDDADLHDELRRVALRRKAAGGQGIGLVERLRDRGLSNDPKRRMIAAARLLAHDPGDVDALRDAAAAAERCGFAMVAELYGAMVAKLECG